jgi:hypothetical protein
MVSSSSGVNRMMIFAAQNASRSVIRTNAEFG